MREDGRGRGANRRERKEMRRDVREYGGGRGGNKGERKESRGRRRGGRNILEGKCWSKKVTVKNIPWKKLLTNKNCEYSIKGM